MGPPGVCSTKLYREKLRRNLRINSLCNHLSLNYGKVFIIIYRKRCLWYSTPKIVSFSVKKESEKFYSTDPWLEALGPWVVCKLYPQLQRVRILLPFHGATKMSKRRCLKRIYSNIKSNFEPIKIHQTRTLRKNQFYN